MKSKFVAITQILSGEKNQDGKPQRENLGWRINLRALDKFRTDKHRIETKSGRRNFIE